MSNNFVSSDLITTNSMRNFASDNDGDGWPILLYNLKHDFDLSDISRHYYPSRLSSSGQRTMEKILHWKIPSDMSHSYRHPQHKIFHALSVISSVDYRSVDFLDRLKCRGNLLIPTIAVFFLIWHLKATGLWPGKFNFQRVRRLKYTGLIAILHKYNCKSQMISNENIIHSSVYY